VGQAQSSGRHLVVFGRVQVIRFGTVLSSTFRLSESGLSKLKLELRTSDALYRFEFNLQVAGSGLSKLKLELRTGLSKLKLELRTSDALTD